EPATESDLDHRDLDSACREVVECQGGGDLEEGALPSGRETLEMRQPALQPATVGPPPGDADALAEVDQMGRGEEPGAIAGFAQHPLDQRAHRPLAVGARDMNRAKALVGVAERAHQGARAVEPQLVLAAL